ncbi:MAG: DUF952 domain-containing protein [Nannocystaceae bacterium]
MIYKLCSAEGWAACQRDGRLPWSADDRRDGFIHLSAAHQLHGTAAKHFRDVAGLVLLQVDPARLPEGALRWEVSRGGDRFPHLHGELPLEAVARAEPTALGPDGVPRLPVWVESPS